MTVLCQSWEVMATAASASRSADLVRSLVRLAWIQPLTFWWPLSRYSIAWEEAFELVGVVRAVDLWAVAVLVLVDEAAKLLGDGGRKPGGLVVGDMLVVGGLEVAAAEVGDVADTGLLGIVPDREECRACGVGSLHCGEEPGDDGGAEGVLGDGFRVLDAA